MGNALPSVGADYFPADSYQTPKNIPRALREYLLLGTRWSPYSFFFGAVFRSLRKVSLGEYGDDVWAETSYHIIKFLEQCGANFHITGLNKIRSVSGPLVFISNHMSTLETVALPGLICPIKPVTYVVKQKLVKGPFWGPIMRSRDPIIVTRKDARADLMTVLHEGQERLSKGISVIVFPQGTRSDVFDRNQFNSLGIKLAVKAGVPFMPVAVRTDFWGNSPVFRGFGPIRRANPIYIEFGDPVYVEGRGRLEHEECVNFIESRLRTWGATVVNKELLST